MLKVLQTFLTRIRASKLSSTNGVPLPRNSDLLRIAIVLSLLLLAVGCGDPNRARIVGRWEISVGDRVLDRVDNSSAADASTATQGFESDDEAPRLVVQFFNSGSLQTETRISDAISTKVGTWSLLEFNGEDQVVKIQCELIGQVTEHEITLLSEDEIKMVPPNLAGLTKKLTFKRK